MKTETAWDMGYRGVLPNMLRQRLRPKWVSGAPTAPGAEPQFEDLDGFLLAVARAALQANQPLWIRYLSLTSDMLHERGIHWQRAARPLMAADARPEPTSPAAPHRCIRAADCVKASGDPPVHGYPCREVGRCRYCNDTLRRRSLRQILRAVIGGDDCEETPGPDAGDSAILEALRARLHYMTAIQGRLKREDLVCNGRWTTEYGGRVVAVGVVETMLRAYHVPRHGYTWVRLPAEWARAPLSSLTSVCWRSSLERSHL
eukprot:SAG31_NODE_6792_length_1886_cov_1.601567_1_plen_259_part_00